jgi:DNA-binding transcriptional LysR family regulator
MSNLDDVRVFANVAEGGSFSAGAKLLGVTRSAISRRVDLLEKRLGVRLLNRTTRHVQLTEAGEEFYRRCVNIMSEIANAEQAAAGYADRPQGLLRIHCPVMIGLHKIMTLIPEFVDKNPLMKIHLDLSDDRVDMNTLDHDIVICWGDIPDVARIATKVGKSRRILCAAPSYLRRYGTPRNPGDLLQHNCVMLSGIGTTHNEWAFRQGSRNRTIRVSGNFVVNSGNGNYEALMAGLGIGRVTNLRVQTDIQAGRLQRILQEYEIPEATPIFALYQMGPHVPPKIKSFVSSLRAYLRDNNTDDDMVYTHTAGSRPHRLKGQSSRA